MWSRGIPFPDPPTPALDAGVVDGTVFGRYWQRKDEGERSSFILPPECSGICCLERGGCGGSSFGIPGGLVAAPEGAHRPAAAHGQDQGGHQRQPPRDRQP